MTARTQIGYTDGFNFSPSQDYGTPRIIKTLAENSRKILGYTYGYMANRGEIRTPAARKSQDLLYSLNNNWVCLAVTNYQKTYYSTDIYAHHLKTSTDRDIEEFVKHAHSRHVKVCLKPMVNSEDGVWRAHIGFPDFKTNDMDSYWAKWFQSYLDFILHYAVLAEELHCEMLCIGCEMISTEHRKYEWLYIIEQVRKVYSGKLIYNTNHDHEDAAEWFDVLDYIGTSAYYPVGSNGTDKESMKQEWTKIKYRLNAIAESRKKKYIFMEIGCRSATGCSTMPWDYSETQLPFNEEEQANFYESCLDVFLTEPNFAGMFWWDWPIVSYNSREEALQDTGFSIHLKKAESIVKKAYNQYF